MRRATTYGGVILRLASIGAVLFGFGCTGGSVGSDGLARTGSTSDGGGRDDRYGHDDVDLDGPADQGGDADADADADGDYGPVDGCEGCINQSCAAEYAACGNSAECIALEECGSQCQDEACYTQCEQDHPTGTAPLFAFYDCIEASCAAACGGDAGDGDPGDGDPGDGDPGDGDPVEPDDPCMACGDQACGAEWQGCEQSQDCQELLGCYGGCGEQDDECFYGCEDQYPNGADVYFGFLDCLFASCAAECGG